VRARLFIVFLVPLTCIMLALGGAYAVSVSRTIGQEFTNQQLGDLSYFLTSTRHALRANNPAIVESEMVRYAELYGADIAAIDRSGEVWAAGRPDMHTLDENVAGKVALALSGRRTQASQGVAPWSFADLVMVEPVFDDGTVIGAVMISASAERPRGEVTSQWIWLVVVAVLLVAILIVVVLRLSNWVLQPMRRVDEAMAAIEHGDMEARIDDDTGPPEMQSMIRVFNQMADEIERVVSRQQEFVLNASHELRNPLGALLLRVEYLATGLDASWEADVEKARDEGQRMSRILDTLLFMAKAEKKDSPFVLVNLVELVRDRVAAWQQIADSRGVKLSVSADASVVSLTDRTAVESAFDAVIDNALKFAPRGTTIEIGAQQGADCAISVRDHGPGIDADDLHRVTDRFWRSPRDQNVPGSGLGLAIATDLLESLGGSLHVAAAQGGGLVVTLHLVAGES
jgi:signal transduction histidine kinase